MGGMTPAGVIPAGTGRRSCLSFVPLGCAQLIVRADGPLIELRHSAGSMSELLLSAVEARVLAAALLRCAGIAEGG